MMVAFPADKGDERWRLIALLNPADPNLIQIVKNRVLISPLCSE